MTIELHRKQTTTLPKFWPELSAILQIAPGQFLEDSWCIKFREFTSELLPALQEDRDSELFCRISVGVDLQTLPRGYQMRFWQRRISSSHGGSDGTGGGGFTKLFWVHLNTRYCVTSSTNQVI